MTGAASTQIGMLATARAMVQPIHDAGRPVENTLMWSIGAITVTIGDSPMAGLFGDMFAQSTTGWECGVSAVLSVEGWPPPAAGGEYDETERVEILRELSPHYRHVLWDHVATIARVQNGLVAGGLNIPKPTPDHQMTNEDDLAHADQ